MTEPNFLASIDSRMGLETPQIVVDWTFGSPTSPMDFGVEWDWTELFLRRRDYRFPESTSEGHGLLSESFSTAPSTSFADITTLEELVQYYSLFFSYKEVSSSVLPYTQDIKRLLTITRGISAQTPLVEKVTGSDLLTTASSDAVTSAGSTFRTSGVAAGDLLSIASGADAGIHVIANVVDETTLSLTANLTATAGPLGFTLYSDEIRLAVTGATFENREVVFIYNTQSQMVDQSYDFTPLLNVNERLLGVVDFDDQVATSYLSVVTTSRYIRVEATTLPVTLAASDIAVEWDLDQGGSGGLDGGFSVGGVELIYNYAGTILGVGILDSVNENVKVLSLAAGAVVSTYDLSGLPETGSLKGLSQDRTGDDATITYILVGNLNYVYVLPDDDLAPATLDILSITHLRDLIDAGIAWGTVDSTYFSNDDSLYSVFDLNEILDKYVIETAHGIGGLWQQENVPDAATVALYHFHEGSELTDSGPNAYTATNGGMTLSPGEGRFGDGIEAVAATDDLDVSAISASFDGQEGAVSLWFRAQELVSTDIYGSGTHILLSLIVNGSNSVIISIVAGVLTFEYIAGGTTTTVSAAHPLQDDRWHQYKLTWTLSSDEVRGYFDGAQFESTESSLGTFVGTLVAATVGDTTSSAIGFYDEIRFTDIIPRNPLAVLTRTTQANRTHSYSGRDPVNRDFNYRDEFFHQRFLGGDWMIRNDVFVEATTENQVLDDGEVIFRQDSKELGDLGRTARLLGLFLDRIHDDRDFFNAAINNLERMDFDFIPDAADRQGILGMDDDWNVDRKRRFLRHIRRVLKQGGTNLSYHKLSKLYDFKLAIDTLLARRFLDSVPDTAREDIPFDTMGVLDTSDPLFPLAILRMTWYKQIASGTDGAIIGAVGAREFSSVGADFTVTAKAGSLLRVEDLDSSGADGDYIVVSVLSATTLLLDRDWPVSGLSTLSYDINWEVPNPDPYNNFLLDKVGFILPDVMQSTLL